VQFDEEIIRRSPNATDASSQQASPSIQYASANNKQSFSSARVPFSTIRSNQSSGLTSMDHSLAVKVQTSSTPKVSHHAFAFLAFELVTSTNQNSSATTALKAIAKMQSSPDSNATCNAFGTLAHEHQPLKRTHPIFQLIDVSILNTNKMCGASHLAANEHKGLFDSKSLSNNDFRLVVDSKLILHSEGKHTTKPNGLFDHDNLVYFDNHIGLVGPIKLVELIGHVGHTNNFVGPSQLIAESKYSKISLHFYKDCGIFCEGDQENTNNGNDTEDDDVVVWQKSNLPLLLLLTLAISTQAALNASAPSDTLAETATFGQISLINLLALSNHWPIGLIGIISLGLISLVGLSGFGLVGLSGISGLAG
jgi:hypothetical protein